MWRNDEITRAINIVFRGKSIQTRYKNWVTKTASDSVGFHVVVNNDMKDVDGSDWAYEDQNVEKTRVDKIIKQNNPVIYPSSSYFANLRRTLDDRLPKFRLIIIPKILKNRSMLKAIAKWTIIFIYCPTPNLSTGTIRKKQPGRLRPMSSP